MNKIELKFEEKQGYSHHTGKQIKILPFVSNVGAKNLGEDFRLFKGVVGDTFRFLQNKELLKELQKGETNLHLKHIILEKALANVQTNVPEDLKRILTDMFFDENGNLIKFHINTLTYLDFVSSEPALKNLGRFVFDTFFFDQNLDSLEKNQEEENILNKLMLESLPGLKDSGRKAQERTYINLQPSLSNLFEIDFNFLRGNNELFLKHIEDLIKFYYFQYFAQLTIDFRTFGLNALSIKAISFTLDWEILSSSRLNSHQIAWKNVFNDQHKYLFVHANVLELLNHIYINEETIGDYHNIRKLYNELDPEDKISLEEKIRKLIKRYTNSITSFKVGGNWEDCEEKLRLSLENRSLQSNCDKLIYELWYKVRYQFENSTRGAASDRYISWFRAFCDENFLKNRGRLRKTFTLNQELLLFLTRLCVGKNDKVRLKQLWSEFERRGIHFDEGSKSEIVKLYEKINLIEKKSDSGDAQYVKSII